MRNNILAYTLNTLLAAKLANCSPHYADYHQIATRQGSIDGWTPPGDDDLRGPCPMLNTLANHGFINHSGKNLTEAVVVAGLGAGLNFDPALGKLMFEMAIVANPQPNATEFSLGNLQRHNVLEHDASLSRLDKYHGNNFVFNQDVFDETRSYWTSETVDAIQLTNSKLARQITSRKTNPTYTFIAMVEEFSIGELLAPIVAFGDIDAVTTNRTLMEYFFEQERLPSELGWSKTETSITLEIIGMLSSALHNATSLITTGTPVVVDKRQLAIVDSHFGRIEY
ncbi:unnamed protein product [Discula destructiva]